MIAGNVLDGNGLSTATQQELIDFLTTSFKEIYGPNIDLSSSSQDGQMQNIFVQVVLDVEDIVATAYAARDINQAVGTQLDTLINWIQRLGGTETLQPISITTTQALTLFGLDQSVQPVFTVADPSGNQYQLLNTQNIGGAGTNSFNFQAAQPGAIQSGINTITVPVTIVLGVSAINNPTTWTTLGINAETDAAFRLRGLSSTAIASQGFFNSLLAGLRNNPGDTTAILYENYLDSTSPNAATQVPGIPPHCIWAIVQGTASPATIAQTIYNQRSLGCNMKGAQTFVITQADGSPFVVQWDNVVALNLFIQFTVTSIDGINAPKISLILSQLPLIFTPGIGATVNVNQIQAAVQQIDPNTLVTNAGFSLSQFGVYTSTLTPTNANQQFQVLSAHIYILPILMLPQTVSVARNATQQFTAYGGTQTGYVYSVVGGGAGGTINAGTGLYTAPAAIGTGTDTVRVVDSNANVATSTVTVI